MEQLISHLIGEYILQNDWMAQKKTKRGFIGFLACLTHVLTYSIPFLFITTSWLQIFLIIITHFFIDRYRLGVYSTKLINWNWESNNYGFQDKMPAYLSTWLMIIVDNTYHLLINYLILLYI